MTKKGKIPGLLLILLLLLLSNNGSVPSFPDSAHFQGTYSALNSGNDRPVVSITKHTVVKDWIKVRYKGGETPIFGVTIPIQFVHFAVALQIKGLKYVPFVSLPYYSCSKLRGPPAYLS